MMNLEEFRVAELPGTVYYIPDVVSASEESLLLDRISKTPKTKWTQLRNRRLQNWGGMPHPKGMIPEQMPDWLEVNTNC
jgi:alkylated DNA repair protein alkB family protein 6